jgi:hypothetical protein
MDLTPVLAAAEQPMLAMPSRLAAGWQVILMPPCLVSMENHGWNIHGGP